VLSFLTHLPHGTFRSHLCLSLRKTVSDVNLEFYTDYDRQPAFDTLHTRRPSGP
jgi:hypothetical protein